jgi:hypothetical protein
MVTSTGCSKTYLDRRHTGVLNLPNGRRFDVTIDFDNWRDVDGVKFPFDIIEERTGKEPVVTLVTYTDKIEINVPMNESLFSPSGEIGDRRQKTEDRRQKTGDRRQKTGDRRQETGDRKQKTEDRRVARRSSARAHTVEGLKNRRG